MGSMSPLAQGGPALFTSLGPTSTPGGFSGQSFGTPGLPFGFGFPSYGDPLFYFQPAASSFNINRLLGYANGSAVNINVGPTPSHLGMGSLLLGLPFYADSGDPGAEAFGGAGSLGSFFGGGGDSMSSPTGAGGAAGFNGLPPTATGGGLSSLGGFGGGIPYGLSNFGQSGLSSLGGLSNPAAFGGAGLSSFYPSYQPSYQPSQPAQPSGGNLLSQLLPILLLVSLLGRNKS